MWTHSCDLKGCLSFLGWIEVSIYVMQDCNNF